MFTDILREEKKLIFLGGTCANSKWRDNLIPKISSKFECFNPVVEDWTPECQQKEIEMRKKADWIIYVITPAMTGVYSIAEIIDDTHRRTPNTIFCYLETDLIDDKIYTFDKHQCKSLDAVGNMVKTNGSIWFESIDELINFFNGL